MKILGILFDDNTTMEEVLNELKRRGINPDNKTIPIIYGKEKVRIDTVNEFSLDAQELINSCKED